MSQTAPPVGQQKRQYFIGRVAKGNPRGHVAIILIFLYTCCKTSLRWGTSQYFIGRVAIPIACSIVLCFTIPARDDIIYYLYIYIYICSCVAMDCCICIYIYIYICIHINLSGVDLKHVFCILAIWDGGEPLQLLCLSTFVVTGMAGKQYNYSVFGMCANSDGGKAL